MPFRWGVGGNYCKDHTKTHKHTMSANAVADGTYTCTWDSEIQLFLSYHHDMFTKMNKFWNKSCQPYAMNHFQHKRSSEVTDEHGFGFHVTSERFQLKLNPSAYISCTLQTLQFNRHGFWIFLRKNKLKKNHKFNTTAIQRGSCCSQAASTRPSHWGCPGFRSRIENEQSWRRFIRDCLNHSNNLLKIPSASFLIHCLIATLASKILVRWHKIKIKLH